MPISNRCRAKMSWNSTNNSSIFSFSPGVRVESFQSKFSRNFARDSASVVGSSVSRSCKACNLRRIRFWMGVCSSGFPGFYWSWEPVIFRILRISVCLDEAADVMGRLFLVILQKVPGWSRVYWFDIFHLFWRHDREIGNMESLFKFIRVVCEIIHRYGYTAII